MTSLGCAGCGDCCNPVVLSIETADRMQAYWRYRANGGRQPRRRHFNTSYEFAAKHWNEISRNDGLAQIRCDKYDPEHRRCTAYEDRPPVCSDYPWYGEQPDAERAHDLPPRCSYLLDVPPADRPEGARPLIPITPVRRIA